MSGLIFTKYKKREYRVARLHQAAAATENRYGARSSPKLMFTLGTSSNGSGKLYII